MNNNGWVFFTQFGKSGRMFKVYTRGGRFRIQEGDKVLFEDVWLCGDRKARYLHIVEVYNSVEND